MKLQLDILRLSQSLLQHRKRESTDLFHSWESSLATQVFGFFGVLSVGLTLLLQPDTVPGGVGFVVGIAACLASVVGLGQKTVECCQYRKRKREWVKAQMHFEIREQRCILAMKASSDFLKQIGGRLTIDTTEGSLRRSLRDLGALTERPDANDK